MKKKPNLFTQRTLSNLFVIAGGVLLYLLLSNFAQVGAALGNFFSIFSPFVAGLVIAYLLNIPMRFFEKHLFARFKRKRPFSILLTYALALFLIFVLLSMVIPQLVESVRTLLSNVNVYLGNLNNLVETIGRQLDFSAESIDSFVLSYDAIVTFVMDFVRSLLPSLPNLTMQISSGIVSALTAIIASIYMLASRDKLLRQCRRVIYALLPKRRADELMRVGRLSNGVFSGFISGKLLDSAIIGIICFVFMSVMSILSGIFGINAIYMNYAPLISVIIGVTNIIPFFGPFIGAIPSVMILLMVNPWSAVWFTVFIIVLQQFDGNVLGPKILGDSTGLPALWVLVAIIVGSGLFGFAGMLLGVPTVAVLYTLASDTIEKRLRKKRLADTSQLSYGEPSPGEAPGGEHEEEANLADESSTPPNGN